MGTRSSLMLECARLELSIRFGRDTVRSAFVCLDICLHCDNVCLNFGSRQDTVLRVSVLFWVGVGAGLFRDLPFSIKIPFGFGVFLVCVGEGGRPF